jgi:hypothetical protein
MKPLLAGTSIALVGLTALAGLVGCARTGGSKADRPIVSVSSDRPAHSASAAASAADSVASSNCPSGLPSCRSAKGRIVYSSVSTPTGMGTRTS